MTDKKFGMSDYYDYFIKNNPGITIDRQKFNNIISEFNKELALHLIDNLEIKLPNRLGKLEILKSKRKVYIDHNGKVKNSIPIDWKATNELWEKDPQMKENKVLIRYDNKLTNNYVFRVYYNKHNAVYRYKSVYFFKPVRSLSRDLAARIKDYSKSKYDTYIKSTKHVQR